MPHATPPAPAPRRTADRPVYVIGAGPGGLAAARSLRAAGIRAVVLERSTDIAASWRRHYERLRLHSPRRLAALPGLRMPRRSGRRVSPGDMVRYLEKYADHHDLEIVTGVEVDRVDRAPEDSGWLLHATGGRVLAASAVVVATGRHRTPRLPGWEGQEDFHGELLHSSGYREAAPYRDREVLVVGAGSSGAGIAVDLAAAGADKVRLAVRTPPHLLRRSLLGVPVQRAGVLCRRLPVPLVDRLAAVLVRLSVPNLAEYGLGRPERGLATRARQGAAPVLDPGLIRAVRKRRVEPVAAVESFDGGKVLLADGTLLAPEVLIAATGYRPGLEELLGHLDVLDAHGLPTARPGRSPANAPGLFFTGYTAPLGGTLREIGRETRKIAKAIRRHL
ncbi:MULTISPECIES: flavin-containing monooxygenase [Streptomyces]|nr:NAD(P)/FAD-dependent oxidoreductase [Streptomyces sp. SCSIO ZS0520]